METQLFPLRTTIGQEKNVAELIAAKMRRYKIDIKAILVPEEMRGYIFVEAENQGIVESGVAGVPHVRGVLPDSVPIEEVQHFMEAKPLIAGVEIGDIVELIAGPFKGEKAKVVRFDEGKGEITVELLEATVSIPVTVRGDHVRVLLKEERV